MNINAEKGLKYTHTDRSFIQTIQIGIGAEALEVLRDTECALTDMLGRDAKTIIVNNKTTETIDISDLNAGIYSIRVSTHHGSITSKLVISR